MYVGGGKALYDPHQLNNVDLPPQPLLLPPYPCRFLAVTATRHADSVADVQGLGPTTQEEAEVDVGLRRSTLVFAGEESVGGADRSQSHGQARGATNAPSKDAKHVAGTCLMGCRE